MPQASPTAPQTPCPAAAATTVASFGRACRSQASTAGPQRAQPAAMPPQGAPGSWSRAGASQAARAARSAGSPCLCRRDLAGGGVLECGKSRGLVLAGELSQRDSSRDTQVSRYDSLGNRWRTVLLHLASLDNTIPANGEQ
jgi:hypothetical protein